MIYKTIFISIFFVIATLSAQSQQIKNSGFISYRDSLKREYENYRLQKKTEFEQYRQRLNIEYAEMIGGNWEGFKNERTKEPPAKPKPVKPIVVPEQTSNVARTIQVKKVIPPENKISDVPVTLPRIDRSQSKKYPVNFIFYGTQCGINRFDTSSLSLQGKDNASLKRSWTKLTADGNLEHLIEDCLRLREMMQLCDWGFVKLVAKIAETFFPTSEDSQAFLTEALMTQAGYDCRLVIKNGHLAMSFHPSHVIFGQTYNVIDGKEYYIYGPQSKKEGAVTSYRGNFKESPTPVRMIMDRYPLLAPDMENNFYTSSGWKEAPQFEIPVNKNVMQFFDDYPLVNWSIYGLSPLSPDAKSKIIPVMEILTEGMEEAEAVNLILNYLHHGFKYMTDGDQFGREKPFFPDENFHYPYNDCEDRAILFSKLVRDVLGLDVVYIELPNHLATAVRFSPNIKITGTSVNIEGYPYYICDPTCIGGRAGYLPTKYNNAPVTVHKIEQ